MLGGTGMRMIVPSRGERFVSSRTDYLEAVCQPIRTYVVFLGPSGAGKTQLIAEPACEAAPIGGKAPINSSNPSGSGPW